MCVVGQEHGSGAADASQSEGHQSKLTARMASETQTQKKTQVRGGRWGVFEERGGIPSPFGCVTVVADLFQSFKRKPGRADNERSTGDYNERVNKRLRTVESSKDRAEESRQSEGRQEAELYEHIKEGDASYDAQTYGG